MYLAIIGELWMQVKGRTHFFSSTWRARFHFSIFRRNIISTSSSLIPSPSLPLSSSAWEGVTAPLVALIISLQH